MKYEGMRWWWGSLQCVWPEFMRLEYEINLLKKKKQQNLRFMFIRVYS